MGFSGGCSCCAVRYTISAEPIRGFQCQCRDCQMDSGGGHSSVLVFSRATFEISGERFAKSRAPATEVQRNERAFARTAVSRSTTSRTRVPNSSASMSEASTVPCLSSPPSSSTPRAAMPGIFWTLTFQSCRSGIRTRNSNRAIRKNRLVRVSRVGLATGQPLPVHPYERTSSTGPVGPFRANSRLMHRIKQHLYSSITVSALVSSAGGTMRPSALAVFRLITNSYLTGAWTGSSLGISPLRTRST